MKNITNKSIKEDISVICNLLDKYNNAIWEPQESQKAHFDNQHKVVKLAMVDVRTGLCIALEAMKKLREIGVLEDEEGNNLYKN